MGASSASRGDRPRPAPALDAPGARGRDPGATFFARVYALARHIPRGRVTTYGALARALGVPRGARTVGWALGACPDDVPWHRVVNGQGGISWRPGPGFRVQRALLRAEGVRFNRRGRIDLTKYRWRAL